jgi:pimeloyl-[acyl-carrier protein] methyl ester esterase
MTLHIESMGQGRDLVLIHGWGMHSRCWDPVSIQLSSKLRIHLVDLPGHGLSPHQCGSTWIELLSEAFPFEVDLCGWSLGGQLAIEWSRQRPDQVGRLALISSTPCFTARGDWVHGIAGDVFLKFSNELETGPEAALKRFLFLQAQGGADAMGLFRQLQQNMSGRIRAGIEGLKVGLELLQGFDLRMAAKSVTQRTLILHGECDRLTPIGAGRWLSENMPDARLVALPDCAHVPFFFNPDLCVANLLEFFNGP